MMKLQHNSEVIGQAIVALPAPRPHFRRWVQRALGVIGMWMERSVQRRALADLDDRFLKDVGITRAEASREIAKPFWR